MSLPSSVGVSLKPSYYNEAANAPADCWFEVHPENYMTEGGEGLRRLAQIRRSHAISFHGIGASLPSPEPLDKAHLRRLKQLIERFNPAQISEHAAWTAHGGFYFADLLPLPRLRVTRDTLIGKVQAFQEALQRRILLENPASYFPLRAEMEEPVFLSEIARATGCGLLIDLNNIFVSAHNVGIDPDAYIAAIPGDLVGEIHIAGHVSDALGEEEILIDSHDAPVCGDVWGLLDKALTLWGGKPILLERDDNLPPFAELLRERERAVKLLKKARTPLCA